MRKPKRKPKPKPGTKKRHPWFRVTFSLKVKIRWPWRKRRG